MKAEEIRASMAERLKAVQEAGNYNSKTARGFARMAQFASENGTSVVKKGEK